jgi:periplasmic protein TonB
MSCGEVSMFDSVKQLNPMDGAKHFTSLLLSLFIHATVLCVVVVLPLIFVKAIQEGELLTFLIAPVPPQPPQIPSPPSARSLSARDRPVVIRAKSDEAPTFIPNGIPDPSDDAEINDNAIGALVNGIQSSANKGPGVSEAIAAIFIPEAPKLQPPPKPPERIQRELVKMGGKILDARLIRRVIPAYPYMAKIARISGPVDLEATIDEEGNVTNLHVLRGHVLLREAAFEAVSQWKYQPLILNGEPVAVLASITVVFRFN